MQNRRIIDRIFGEVGVAIEPILETNSLEILATHLRAGQWSSVLPRIIAEPLRLPERIIAIPIVAPEMSTLIGMVVSVRDPQPPLTTALINEVRRLAPDLAETA
jgi:DNA-binding transcriptional LysR family regulator